MTELLKDNSRSAKNTAGDRVCSEFIHQFVQMTTLQVTSRDHIDEVTCKSTESEYLIVDEFMAYVESPKYGGDSVYAEFVYQSSKFRSDPCDFSEHLRKEDDGRISLAYERLPGIPKQIAGNFASNTHTLDLSYNNIKDLSFLSNFKTLHTLIMDNNILLNVKTLPFLPGLQIFWLNKCGIKHLPKWVHRIRICTPNVRQLSLLGNPGVRSSFNGGTTQEHNDYMMYMISVLPQLDHLDDVKITNIQRKMAIAHATMYAFNNKPKRLEDLYSMTTNIHKCDDGRI